MDIGEGYFGPNQQQPQQQQQQQQPQQQPQLMIGPPQQQSHEMQYEANGSSMDMAMDGGGSCVGGPMQVAIPLPAPPTPVKQPAALSCTEGSTGDVDIDALLLQQFSCLGTTDHEDLIVQFQTLLNNQMSRDSARFYLEMSNWNLQTAVGCYLDYCNYQVTPSMKIVDESRPNPLQLVIRLQNDGNEDWPNGCYLKSTSQQQQIQLPALKSGETCDIQATLALQQPPVMWRLCTPNGWYFGEPIWMLAPTAENIAQDSSTELAQRLSQLHTDSVEMTPAAAVSTVANGGPSGGGELVPEINIVVTVNME